MVFRELGHSSMAYQFKKVLKSPKFNEIAKSQDNYKKIQDKLLDGVLLYGAGFIGQWSVQYLESQRIKIRGFRF